MSALTRKPEEAATSGSRFRVGIMSSWRARAGELSLAAGRRAMDSVSGALRRLPRRVRYIPADAITIPLSYLWWTRLPIIQRNFAIVLGNEVIDSRARRLARASIRNYGRMAIDFLVARTSPVADLAHNMEAHGEEYYRESIAGGHGVIFVLPHLGSWDVAAILAQLFQCRLTIVTESDWGTQLVAGSREQQGVTLVPRDRSLRALFRALSRNEAVVLLSDMANKGVQVISVPFFGKPSPFPDGPARLSVRTGAPVMVVSCVRREDASYVLSAQPPLRADPALDPEENVRMLTEKIAQGFESVITKYPEHWYPYHPYWP